MSMVRKTGNRIPGPKTQVGQVSGELTVVDPGPFYNSDSNIRLAKRNVLVRCSCYLEFYTRENNIIRGLSTRCRSCKNKSHGEKLRGSNTGWNIWYNRYRQNARNRARDILFELTVQDVMNICSRPCQYCDLEPEPRILGREHHILASGIDRVDTDKGYTIENCVPCCTKCNRMKWDYSMEEFLTHVIKIANKECGVKK